MYQTHSGFTILEILLSFTLLSLVYTPLLGILNMLYIKENTKMYTEFDTLISKSVAGVSDVMYSNGDITSCPSFKGNIRYTTYSSKDLGIGTSTRITYIKAIGGKMVLALDSSEVKDPDIAVLSRNDMSIESKLDISPGTTDISFSGTYVLETHSGVSSDIGILSLYPRLQLQKTCTLKTDRRDGKKAQAIQAVGENILVGFEKNDGPELFLIDRNCTVLDSIEYGFGIHDIYAINNSIYVLSPSNPELLSYTIDDKKIKEIKSLDLPGDSGNARSFDFTHSGFVFGRSKGNDEFVFLDIHINKIDSIKIGSSIDVLISGTSTYVLLTSNSEKELQIYTTSTLINSLDLPARANAATCLGEKVYIGTNATSTSLIVIEET